MVDIFLIFKDYLIVIVGDYFVNYLGKFIANHFVVIYLRSDKMPNCYDRMLRMEG